MEFYVIMQRLADLAGIVLLVLHGRVHAWLNRCQNHTSNEQKKHPVPPQRSDYWDAFDPSPVASISTCHARYADRPG